MGLKSSVTCNVCILTSDILFYIKYLLCTVCIPSTEVYTRQSFFVFIDFSFLPI